MSTMVHSFRATAIGLGLVTLCVATGVHAFGQGERPALTPADAKVVGDFQARVAAYVALHNKIEGAIKPLSKEATPQQIDVVLRDLFQGIAAARATAKPGDIFTPEVQAYMRRVLAKVFSGPDGQQRRASILDENPIGTAVRVNGLYPDAIPLSTMPPQLIEALPKLPDEVEYRFVGDRLILFDHHAHLMVDYVDRALPRA